MRAGRLFILLAALALSHPTCAQLSGQIALLSDYRLRGVSLTQGNPALQASVNYDHASGLFAGAMASTVRIVSAAPATPAAVPGPYTGYAGAAPARTASVSSSGTSTQVYGGYAHALGDALSWEAGVVRYLFPHAAGIARYDYGEVFVGASSLSASVRLHLSDDYYGRGARMRYAEFNWAHPLTDQLALSVHVGRLDLRPPAANGADPQRTDYKFGLARRFSMTVIELALVGSSARNAVCPGSPRNCRTRGVVSLSHDF